MRWIDPTEKSTAAATVEKRLWDAADQFRANSGLKPQEYSGPILGFAEVRFAAQRAKLDKAGASARRGSRVGGSFPSARRACGLAARDSEYRGQNMPPEKTNAP